MQDQQNSIQLETAQNHKLAMTVALISWSMLFATLLMGFFVYRFSQTVWPPFGVAEVSMLLPNLSLAVVFASSITFYFALHAFKQKKYFLMRVYTWATLGLGLAYMFFQIKFWENLNAMKLFSSSNIFGSILHGFTWIHAAHMVCAMVALIFAMFVLRKNDRIERWQNLLTNVSMFWHFLTIVWAVLYYTLFIF